MSPRQRFASLLVCALALAGAGLAGGAWAAWVASPVALGLIALAVAHGRREPRSLAGWIVALGAVAWLLAVPLLLSGAVLGSIAAIAAGALALYTGGQASLASHAAPPDSAVPAPRSLRTSLAAAVDESMRWIWGVSAWLSASPDPRERVEALRSAAQRNRAEGVLEDPSRAHPMPPALEKVVLERVPVLGSGEVEHLRFESEFTPRDPEEREAYLDLQPNRTAHAYLWRHRDGPRPTLVCIHGYGMGRIATDVRAWDVGWLHERLGLDLALVILPLHGPRALGFRSGAGFLDGHPLWTNAAFGQALWDLRRLSGWLRREGAPAVGAYGMSLGGYTTALWASLDDDLACAVPMIPAVSLPPLVLSTLSESEVLAARAAGLTEDLLAEAWASHDPLRHRPRVAQPARLLLAGLVDRICPPEQAHALWEHWERPAIHWFPGSHLAPIGRQELRHRLEAHLRKTLLGEPGQEAPHDEHAAPTPLAAPNAALPLTRFRR